MKIALTSHQEKFIEAKMKTGGYISPDEIVREALRVYELVEQDDSDPALAAALRPPCAARSRNTGLATSPLSANVAR